MQRLCLSNGHEPREGGTSTSHQMIPLSHPLGQRWPQKWDHQKREGTKPPAMAHTEPRRRQPREPTRGGSKASSLSPDEDVQREDRDAAIEAVRKITKAAEGTPKKWGSPTDRSMNITVTPRYNWDTGYNGIQGFATQLRNRVSEPPTPERRFSPRQTEVGGVSPPKGRSQPVGRRFPIGQELGPRREGPPIASAPKGATEAVGATQPAQEPPTSNTPRQLLIYDETPAGRCLPTLREIRQANLRAGPGRGGGGYPLRYMWSPRS